MRDRAGRRERVEPIGPDDGRAAAIAAVLAGAEADRLPFVAWVLGVTERPPVEVEAPPV